MTLSVQLWARPPLVPRRRTELPGLFWARVKKAIMLLRARYERTLVKINPPSHKKSECFDLLRLDAPLCGSLSPTTADRYSLAAVSSGMPRLLSDLEAVACIGGVMERLFDATGRDASFSR